MRRRFLSRPRLGRRGQTMVEIVLVMPFLAILIGGLLDVGLLVYAHLELTAAAQEVTRIAGMNDHNAGHLQTIFENELQNIVGTKSINVVTSNSDADLGGRPSATITMTLTFPPIGIGQIVRTTDMTFTSVARTPILTNAGTSGALVAD